MKPDQGPKYQIIEEKVWIPVRDGTRLAATFYKPASDERFPAIFDFHPYRKDDSAPRGDNRYHYFAQRGYITVRVDVRGTGSSEGAPADNEYVLQEQLDGYDVIEWLAAQDWCTGKIGMWGGSYGGFNSVLVASQAPPHLTAISPWFYADDGYSDGDHFEGGCLSALGLSYYGLGMLTMSALPPHPQYYEEQAGRWEEEWRTRLEAYEPWVLEWFRHQTNDAFWRVQSLRPDYQSIKCPIFMIGGWGDHFRNSIPRMLQHCQVPMKAIIGPWVHTLPSIGNPGPNIDFHYQLLRWWDYWLKGIDNGVMDEPSLAVYVQRDRPPGMFAEFAQGYWRYEKGWPIEDAQEHVYCFHPNGILSQQAPTVEDDTPDQFKYRPDVGVMGNVWFSQANTLGEEQSLDEAYSLTYTTAPLKEDLEILGFPRVQLFASSSAENTAFVVKLTEVNPVGESNLVTYGVLNASHRNSHTEPEALEPGKVFKFDIEMSTISWIFKKGHRIRISVTSSHWPILWPLPEPATNRVYHDPERISKLVLPVLPAREAAQKPDLEPPPPKVKTEPVWKPSIKIVRDIVNQETTVEVKGKRSTASTDGMVIREHGFCHVARTLTKDPAISSVRTENYTILHYSNGLTVRGIGTATVSSNKEQFLLSLDVDIEVNGMPFFKKSWLESVPRYFI